MRRKELLDYFLSTPRGCFVICRSHLQSADVAATSTQNKVSLTPVTPVIPVTVEAFTSLHNLITEDACAAACDKACRHPLQICAQKLASAAKICFDNQSLRSRHESVGTGHE
jgi:hypothetical protein